MGFRYQAPWVELPTAYEQLRVLVSEAERLFAPELLDLRARSTRGKSSGKPEADDPRLLRALNHVQSFLALGGEPNANLVADLLNVVTVFLRWQADPVWERLRRTAATPTEFDHTTIQLAVAGFLADAGNGVAFVTEGRGPTPDLQIAVNAATVTGVELKAPKLLNDLRHLNQKEAAAAIERAYKKAKAQLKTLTPSILVIGGFHVAFTALTSLERACGAFFRKHNATELMGVACVSLDAMTQKFLIPGGRTTLTTRVAPVLIVKFGSNPYYKGTIPFSTVLPRRKT